jgi:hypothetical protein
VSFIVVFSLLSFGLWSLSFIYFVSNLSAGPSLFYTSALIPPCCSTLSFPSLPALGQRSQPTPHRRPKASAAGTTVIATGPNVSIHVSMRFRLEPPFIGKSYGRFDQWWACKCLLREITLHSGLSQPGYIRGRAGGAGGTGKLSNVSIHAEYK